MNEIQQIRTQLDAERDRVGAVAQACAAAASLTPAAPAVEAAIAAFHQAGLAYLRRVLGWFDERDQRLRELHARLPAGDPDRSLDKLLAAGGSGREALARLENTAGKHWHELSGFLNGAWKTHRIAVDRALGSSLRVVDWRAVAGIDADSILEERRLYAEVRQHLPAGTAATAGL